MAYEFQETIDTAESMRELMGQPSQIVNEKSTDHLDQHNRAFIARSPFLIVASSDENGGVDASPKGDAPGFVLVLDDTTLVIPERLGNRRADTFENVLRNPGVGLIFLVPGMRETLRVNGEGVLVRDEALRETMAVNGKVPEIALGVRIKEVFFHCGKCVIRSGLWKPEGWASCEGLPTLAESIAAVAGSAGNVDELQESIEQAYRERLY